MKRSKILISCFSSVLVLTLASCHGPREGEGEFTYKTYTAALATNWNPHTWETNADNGVLSYLSEGLVSLSIKDSSKGEHQWVYDMATSIEDVTRSKSSDLLKYGVFKTQEEVDEYFKKLKGDNKGQIVYQIKLRDGLKWEDGTAITADTFVESGKLLLDPTLKNYRANLFYSGESALAGARGYFYQGLQLFTDNKLSEGVYQISDESALELKDGVYVQKGSGLRVKFVLGSPLSHLSGYSFKDYVDAYGEKFFDMTVWDKLVALADKETLELNITVESLALFKELLTNSTAWEEKADDWVNYVYVENVYPEVTFDTVGLYKVDDLTFVYVMENPLDIDSTLTSFTSTWLVHKPTYEKFLDKSASPFKTTYGTSLESTVSYGPYRLESLQASKQMVLVKNENWWGYSKDENDKLVSFTEFLVDGKKVEQYKATKVVIDVMTDAAAKQNFEVGLLSDYAPTASELSTYTRSDSLYQVDETYTMSLFFNTNLEHLKVMDESKGNQNSVVLSSEKFRKAFSLAIDRAEFVTATAAYKPAFSILNSLYYYDIWKNPESRYRDSDEAMQAICNLYGVKYGPGTSFPTLKDAYKSITGLNLADAKKLMKEAFDELTKAGLYTGGSEIKIRLAYAKGPIQSDENAQVALLQKYLNQALEGSGFGTATLEPIGNLEDRYKAVPTGEFAIGYGGWGGAAFYPFRNFEVYCNPDNYSINEAACWDPKTETLKISFTYKGVDSDGNEKEIAFENTLTWQEWSTSMTGSGRYANYNNEFKLKVTAALEQGFLEKYYRIPLASTTAAFLLSRQVSYYTENYHILYDFGGFRLLKFNYDDADWKDYVDKHNGKIDYTVAEQ